MSNGKRAEFLGSSNITEEANRDCVVSNTCKIEINDFYSNGLQ